MSECKHAALVGKEFRESWVYECKDCGATPVSALRDLQDRITELEAPFILTDQVPTVPGVYIVVPLGGDWYMRNYAIDELQSDWLRELARVGYKFGCTPLPQPQEKNDGH